jgi:hypothetical protein
MVGKSGNDGSRGGSGQGGARPKVTSPSGGEIYKRGHVPRNPSGGFSPPPGVTSSTPPTGGSGVQRPKK